MSTLSGILAGTFQGSQGVQGTGGSQGSQGLQGVQGLQGTQGVQGLSNQGISGAQGSQGLQGTQGAQGTQGLSNQGISGAQGAQGTIGIQGFSPTNIPASTNTTLTSTDAGKHINTAVAIAVSSNTGFATGDMCTIYNNSATTIGVNTSGTGVTLRFAGTGSVGNRFLSQRGLASILCVASNDYVVSGAGLT